MPPYIPKGKTNYTMDFWFQGTRIKKSTGTKSRVLAERIERAYRLELEEGRAGLKKVVQGVLTFRKAAEEYIEINSLAWSPDTLDLHNNSLKHLLPVFGDKAITLIAAIDITRYQKMRLDAGASGRTVNIEIGTFRGVTRRIGQWARLQPHVKMLKERTDTGKAIPVEECVALLKACMESMSRNLFPIVSLAMETGARYGTILRLQWKNVDFSSRCLTFGRDKTRAGSGRTIPLTEAGYNLLIWWASFFPEHRPSDYLFPEERYRKLATLSHTVIYDTDVTKPVGSVRKAWETARKRAARILAGVPEPAEGKKSHPIPPLKYRFHDLRHTVFTRMRKSGVPIEMAGQTLGWSRGQIVRMSTIYGHYTPDDMRGALEKSTSSFMEFQSPTLSPTPKGLGATVNHVSN